MTNTGNVLHRTCHLCEAMCGLLVTTDGERITSVRGDKDDVLSRGHICPKAAALADLHEDPDRLRAPLRRRGRDWEEVSWDEALAEAIERLSAIRGAHGNDSVGLYIGNPTVHDHGTSLFAVTLATALGTRNHYSANSADASPQLLVSTLMFGHQLLLPIPDLEQTDFLLVLGANPLVSGGSIMTAPDFKGRLRELQARGGRMVVLDPRRSETAAAADAHHFIRPGTDVFLLAAMIRTIFTERLDAPGHLVDFTDGLGDLPGLVEPFTPERVAGVCGIPSETIEHLARDFARARQAACYGRLGICVQRHGTLTAWLIQCLNIVTGNLDRVGGAMFTTPAVDVVGLTSLLGQNGRYEPRRSRVRGLPGVSGEIPVATLADEIETPGPDQLRGFVSVAGNPVLSAPNGPRIGTALEKLEYYVAIDPYLNETTRHAHLILPPASPLTRVHYDIIFHALAVRNTVKLSPPVFEPPPGTPHDWEVLLSLALGIAGKEGPGRKLLATLAGPIAHALGADGVVKLGMLLGPWGLRRLLKGQAPLTAGRVAKADHGLDLGPLEPKLPGALRNARRRIQLCPEPFVGELKARAAELQESRVDVNGSLRLIGRRQLRSNNSWMHNAPRLMGGKERCTLRMHPADAERSGVRDGERVVIRSVRGEIEVPLELSDELMEGVVSLPHGFGHDDPEARLGVAGKHAGANHNALTDHEHLDTLSGNAAFSGVPVSVHPVPAEG